MALINKEYFYGEIDIPNIDDQINTFNALLDQYEREILTDLLGYPLYKAYKAALVTASGDPDSLPSPWIEFVKGAEFTFPFEGRTVTAYWPGLVNAEKYSLLAYYSYFKLRYKDLSIVTGVNEVKGKTENAARVKEVRKMVFAWNKFIEHYGEIVYTIDGYPIGTYFDNFYFDKHSDTYDYFNDHPSAFNYLNANRDDFTVIAKWIFTSHKRRNEFGI